jgi:hypothetical protein
MAHKTDGQGVWGKTRLSVPCNCHCLVKLLPLPPTVSLQTSLVGFLCKDQQTSPGAKTAPPNASVNTASQSHMGRCGNGTTYLGHAKTAQKQLLKEHPVASCFAVSKPNHCSTLHGSLKDLRDPELGQQVT